MFTLKWLLNWMRYPTWKCASKAVSVSWWVEDGRPKDAFPGERAYSRRHHIAAAQGAGSNTPGRFSGRANDQLIKRFKRTLFSSTSNTSRSALMWMRPVMWMRHLCKRCRITCNLQTGWTQYIVSIHMWVLLPLGFLNLLGDDSLSLPQSHAVMCKN